MKKEVVIIGAGASGIGMACALQQIGVSDFVVLERGTVGESFFNWPKETRFITPSFTTNGFGFPDINAVVPDTSPAYTFNKEHLSGEEYGEYLQMVAKHYDLPIHEDCHVHSILKNDTGYVLETTIGKVFANYLIVATGEFQNPNRLNISGAQYATHYGEVDTFNISSDSPFLVIGGNESGVDAAVSLVESGNGVALYTTTFGRNEKSPDPSISLSPITKSRLKAALDAKYPLTIKENKTLSEIKYDDDVYTVVFTDGEEVVLKNAPILATGFINAVKHIGGDDLFAYNEDNIPLVDDNDESTIVKNVFLVGPSLRQNTIIFCYIYKFRQRFAVVAHTIADRLGVPVNAEKLEWYKRNQMYLPNSQCCDVICDC